MAYSFQHGFRVAVCSVDRWGLGLGFRASRVYVEVFLMATDSV